MSNSNKNNLTIRKVAGTEVRPRLAVFRSNRTVIAQVIDDNKGATLLSISSASIAEIMKPTQRAFAAGVELAKQAKSQKIKELVFDRRAYRYHGQVKALADGIREGGIKI